MEGDRDRESYKQFLREFCQQVSEKTDDTNSVSIRFTNPHVRENELEGECLYWCQEILSSRNCPVTLSAALSQRTYKLLSEVDLEKFSLKNDEDNHLDNKEEEQKDNDDVIRKEYDAESLHDVVVETLENVCKSWSEELPNIPLSAGRFDVQFHAIKNTRRKMEDSHAIIPDLNTLFDLKDQLHQSFYAVFDGHAGVDAANYAGRQLHCNLVRRCPLVENPTEALKSSFKITDEVFCSKAKVEHWRSGCTGVAALIQGDRLHMAWLGDSQAVLVRDGKPVTHMEPHKPDREDERERIENLGGMVMMMGDLWRVGGNIAVSRAIGDASYKPFISSDAEVMSEKLDGTEDYLVLACDGLWDVLEEEDLPRVVYNYVCQNGGDRSGVAKMLVQYAKDNDSTDNISVIVIFFRDQIAEPKVADMFNFFGSASNQDGQQGSGADNPEFKDDNSGSSGKENHAGDKDVQKDISKSGSHSNKRDVKDRSHSDGEVMETFGYSIEAEDTKIHFTGLPGTANNDNQSDLAKLDSDIQDSDVDLDYYQVFDSRLTDRNNDSLLNSSIPHTSDLLKTIANTVYTGRYGPRSELNEPDELLYQDPIYRLKHAQAMDAMNDPMIGRKNGRKQLKPIDQKPAAKKRDNKRGKATSPICWSFTGRNRASVQNHRLNLAARSSSRSVSGSTEGALATKLLSKSYGDLSTMTPRFLTENYGNVSYSPHRKNPYGAPLQTVSNQSTSTLNLTKPVITVFGSKANVQQEPQSFHTSWRPRRPLKPISGTMYESPPTPLANNKL